MTGIARRYGRIIRLALLAAFLAATGRAEAATSIESPMLAEQVAAGKLPPIEARLPETPSIVTMNGAGKTPGEHGGELRILMAKARDTRQMVVYGYARLVCYNEQLVLEPDILQRYEIEDGRIFTLHLRPGHKWSDGQPFSTEDFRYYWEDMANNGELSPAGPPISLLVEGEPPRFEILDKYTVRYTWSKPNPAFLPVLAGARPLYIFAPAHYLKQFHPNYADAADLAERVRKHRQRNWAAMHNRLDNSYKNNNPDLPTLQPWVNTTKPPSERFVFLRNPYYHRVDTAGRQLPYIDRVVMRLAGSKLIPAKTGAGESDLQARYLRFTNVTFLKQSAKRQNFAVHLWRIGKGAHLVLYPNMTVADPTWRKLIRDVRFRRALSLAIDRYEVNQVLYYGLALEGNNTVLPQSPLYRPDYRSRWAKFDLKAANRLLDEIGLKRGDDGIRLLPDGRPATIIVETAGESTEQTDVLDLVHDSWLKAGIKLYTKPMQRETFRNRIFAGRTVMSIWSGLENGLANADMSPAELAPTSQQLFQWPSWGQHYESGGHAGVPPDMEIPNQLLQLYVDWRNSRSHDQRQAIWHRMLEIHADQVFTIGLIGGVLQPVVVTNRLRNVPTKGVYSWAPGAHFGIYRPDTFWFADQVKTSRQRSP